MDNLISSSSFSSDCMVVEFFSACDSAALEKYCLSLIYVNNSSQNVDDWKKNAVMDLLWVEETESST